MTAASEASLWLGRLAGWIGTQAASVILVYFAVTGVTSAQTPQEFCAFEVSVITPTGSPAAGLSVSMIRVDNKKTFASVITGPTGIVKLCDAPVVPVSLMVSSRQCGSVAIEPITPDWPRTQRLVVIHNPIKCQEFNPTPNCQALLRIYDESGRPLQGARFETKFPMGPSSPVSDSLGRLFLSVRRMEVLEGSIVKDGFRPMSFSEECRDDIESKIQMRR